MTRDAGQITPRQALLGGALILGIAAGIVAALGPLVERGEQPPPLPAPAEPVQIACPDPDMLARSQQEIVTAGQLLECPQSYDGVSVTYRGEAVRAILRRGERAWVHLNDDRYALDLGPLPEHRTAVGGNSGIPVSITAAAADGIVHVGDYRHRGDIIRVTGTFQRADPADGGGPTIQADAVVIEQAGHLVEHPPAPRRAVAAGGLAALAAMLSGLARVRRRR